MPRKTLSIATLNLHNLQRPGLPMYPNSAPYTDAEYHKEDVSGVQVGLAVRKPLKVRYSRWLSAFPKEVVLRKCDRDDDSPEMTVEIDRFRRPVLRAAVCFDDDRIPGHVMRCTWFSVVGVFVAVVAFRISRMTRREAR